MGSRLDLGRQLITLRMDLLHLKTGSALDDIANFRATFVAHTRHFDDDAILAQGLHQVVRKSASGETVREGGDGLLDCIRLNSELLAIVVFARLDFDNEGRTTNEVDAAFEIRLCRPIENIRENRKQAKADEDHDGCGAYVALTSVDFSRNIPKDECNDGDTCANDEEWIVLEFHGLIKN